tara:strand:- start:2981 stop:3286 length:306 start_codon:yes stop_codon:yes gene_type:complete
MNKDQGQITLRKGEELYVFRIEKEEDKKHMYKLIRTMVLDDELSFDMIDAEVICKAFGEGHTQVKLLDPTDVTNMFKKWLKSQGIEEFKDNDHDDKNYRNL